MISTDQVSSLTSYLDSAQHILIMLAPQATFDQVASAAALYGTFQEMGKTVSLHSPSRLPSETAAFFDDLDLKTELGNQNLVIGFDYVESAIDKVSYHIDQEANRFYLTIKPRKGEQPLDSQSVDFKYVGADADLIITVGVHDLADLEQLYYGYEDLYLRVPVISFNSYPTAYGVLKIDTTDSSCLSEVTTLVIKELQLPLPGIAADGLLLAIENLTQGFHPDLSLPETFESVAFLLRAGAERKSREELERLTTPTDNSEEIYSEKEVVGEQPDQPQSTSMQQPSQSRRRKKKKHKSQTTEEQQPGSLKFNPGEVRR